MFLNINVFFKSYHYLIKQNQIVVQFKVQVMWHKLKSKSAHDFVRQADTHRLSSIWLTCTGSLILCETSCAML